MPWGAWPDDECLQIRQGDEAEPQDQRDRVEAVHGTDVVHEKRYQYAESPEYKRQDR